MFLLGRFLVEVHPSVDSVEVLAKDGVDAIKKAVVLLKLGTESGWWISARPIKSQSCRS